MAKIMNFNSNIIPFGIPAVFPRFQAIFFEFLIFESTLFFHLYDTLNERSLKALSNHVLSSIFLFSDTGLVFTQQDDHHSLSELSDCEVITASVNSLLFSMHATMMVIYDNYPKKVSHPHP